VLAFADDDMQVSSDWLEEIAGPVVREGLDAVTGPTQAMRLESSAERLFEAYGGHGHARREALFDRQWLAKQRVFLPLWEVGGLGNAAVRREVFEQVGYFHEALGVGTPAGSWEDLDMIYRMLIAGKRILQNPRASVLHAHRDTMAGLKQQLCAYRQGEVCFCLIALLRYHEPRAFSHLMLWIPFWRGTILLGEIGRRLRGQSLFPFALMTRETFAYLTGPIALVRSLRQQRGLTEKVAGRL
jgi:hypothetical protein